MTRAADFQALSALSPGLPALYSWSFRNQFGSPEGPRWRSVRDVLALLCVESCTEAEIEACLLMSNPSLPHSDFIDLMSAVAPFVVHDKSSRLTFYHKSIQDWLCRDDCAFRVNVSRSQLLLAMARLRAIHAEHCRAAACLLPRLLAEAMGVRTLSSRLVSVQSWSDSKPSWWWDFSAIERRLQSANAAFDLQRKLLRHAVECCGGINKIEGAVTYCRVPALIRVLTEHFGVSPDVQDNHGWSWLATCALDDQADAARELLRAGADVESTGSKFHPLSLAARCGHLEMVRLLVEVGNADVLGGASGRGLPLQQLSLSCSLALLLS